MMSVYNEDTQANAATDHLCSRDADEDSVRGWDGYPSDPQRTAPRTKKYFAAHFEDRDQTEEMSDSKTPHRISDRTRSKLVKKQKKCAAVQEDTDNGDLDDEEDLEHEDESDANSGRATILHHDFLLFIILHFTVCHP